jgi:thiazole synthase ThiGH ThiG subunit
MHAFHLALYLVHRATQPVAALRVLIRKGFSVMSYKSDEIAWAMSEGEKLGRRRLG